MDAKRKLEESGMLRRVLDSKEDCPDTKRRRKNAEDSEFPHVDLPKTGGWNVNCCSKR